MFATGFDAMMGFIEIDIRGRDGRTPKEKWEDGPRAYLGVAIAGLPNKPVHRPRQPLRAQQRAGLHRAARRVHPGCIKYTRERDPTRIESMSESEDELARSSTRYGGSGVPPKGRMPCSLGCGVRYSHQSSPFRHSAVMSVLASSAGVRGVRSTITSSPGVGSSPPRVRMAVGPRHISQPSRS